MTDFEKYKIKVDTYAPGLKPRSNPDDLKAIKGVYAWLEKKFKGISKMLDPIGAEKIVITIVKRGGIADDGED